MESPASSCSDGASLVDLAAAAADAAAAQKEREGLLAQVDPFLLEVLENSRHRLTVLRMELDIQRFIQNPDQQQFEFQPLPTSYLRCAAHRVAQHYGLQTMAFDNAVDGLGSRVVARKTPESKYPAVCLSEVPAKLPEKEITEHVKIAIRPRPKIACRGDGLDPGLARNETRTVEERKEEYDKARARIFNGSSNPEVEGSLSSASVDGRSLLLTRDDEFQRNVEEFEKTNYSRVAIFRDREKDRTDPDYDRSYERYVRGLSLPQSFNLQACSVVQPPFLQHDGSIVHYGHMPTSQSHVSYNMPSTSINPYAFGCNQNAAKDAAVYMQWPSPAMIYSNTFEHFGHAMFQAPFYQQQLSFEHTQNC